MKTKLLLFGIILTIPACTGRTTNQETVASDSAQQIQDPIAAQAEEATESTPVIYDAQPFDGLTNNFPDFLMDTFTNDSLESKLTMRMGHLLEVYDTMSYATITSSYYWERPYYVQGQDGPGQMSTETEEEKKTWFFDRSNQLRGYSMTMKSTGNETTKSALYLFSNDSLIAVREQEEYLGDGGFARNITILALQCPRCGLITTEYEGAKDYIDEKGLVSKQQEFYESMPELIQLLKDGRKNATQDDYDLTFVIDRKKGGDTEDKTKTITYPVTFTVTKELYPNYILKH